MLSDEDVSQFQALWKNSFGHGISKEDASQKASQLLRLVSIVYKPMTENDLHVAEARVKHCSVKSN